jgi:hypothetical protein
LERLASTRQKIVKASALVFSFCVFFFHPRVYAQALLMPPSSTEDVRRAPSKATPWSGEYISDLHTYAPSVSLSQRFVLSDSAYLLSTGSLSTITLASYSYLKLNSPKSLDSKWSFGAHHVVEKDLNLNNETWGIEARRTLGSQWTAVVFGTPTSAKRNADMGLGVEYSDNKSLFTRIHLSAVDAPRAQYGGSAEKFAKNQEPYAVSSCTTFLSVVRFGQLCFVIESESKTENGETGVNTFYQQNRFDWASESYSDSQFFWESKAHFSSSRWRAQNLKASTKGVAAEKKEHFTSTQVFGLREMGFYDTISSSLRYDWARSTSADSVTGAHKPFQSFLVETQIEKSWISSQTWLLGLEATRDLKRWDTRSNLRLQVQPTRSSFASFLISFDLDKDAGWKRFEGGQGQLAFEF